MHTPSHRVSSLRRRVAVATGMAAMVLPALAMTTSAPAAQAAPPVTKITVTNGFRSASATLVSRSASETVKEKLTIRLRFNGRPQFDYTQTIRDRTTGVLTTRVYGMLLNRRFGFVNTATHRVPWDPATEPVVPGTAVDYGKIKWAKPYCRDVRGTLLDDSIVCGIHDTALTPEPEDGFGDPPTWANLLEWQVFRPDGATKSTSMVTRASFYKNALGAVRLEGRLTHSYTSAKPCLLFCPPPVVVDPGVWNTVHEDFDDFATFETDYRVNGYDTRPEIYLGNVLRSPGRWPDRAWNVPWAVEFQNGGPEGSDRSIGILDWQ